MNNFLSPLDGRYSKSCKDLAECLGQEAYTHQLYDIEIRWLFYLSHILPDVLTIDDHLIKQHPDIVRIRQIELETGHDVKAVEYYLKERLIEAGLNEYVEYIHFGCTSEDITNIAYSRCIKSSIQVLDIILNSIVQRLDELALEYCNVGMLARTHGQPASPTTVGKEFRNYERRLTAERVVLKSIKIMAKMNGASGNFNALYMAYPNVDWIRATSDFIKILGLTPNIHTTQVEPHDRLAEILHSFCRINSILTDLSCDMWQYISLQYFNLKVSRVGSSTMPHKINPIEFENAEGNFGLANAIMQFMASKLQISRMQRDLSGSTVKRNLGVAFGYCLVGYKSVLRGLQVIEVNKVSVSADLNKRYEVLTEAYQTVMRKHGISDSYEVVRRVYLSSSPFDLHTDLLNLISEFDISAADMQRLFKLTPEEYLGMAAYLAKIADYGF